VGELILDNVTILDTPPWGQGAEPRDVNGYAWLWTKYLKQNASYTWTTSNISIGGNTTTDVTNRWDRDLLPSCSRYVYYGLSLGNEGIHERGQPAFDSWRDNMLLLIERTRSHGKIPIVGSNYPRGDFNAADYSYVKQLNLLIHEWDVPSVNLLGAIDDGAGKWASGYMADNAHPNTAGHAELYCAIVPSLLDALADGKPQPVRTASAFITLKKDGSKAERIAGAPESVLHPFTLTFSFRTTSTAGTIASLITDSSKFLLKIDADGKLAYETPSEQGRLTSPAALDDGQWHQVSLTHYHAWGRTFLYVDGKQADGFVAEKVAPEHFYLNDSIDALQSVDFRELFLHRSAMCAEEVQALHGGKMLKSSLEIYAPLDGSAGTEQEALRNLAQSLNNTLEKDLRISAATGLLSPKAEISEYTLYPNPVSDKIQVAGLSRDKDYRCAVFSMDGKLLLAGELQRGSHTVDVSRLPPSVYLMKIKSAGKGSRYVRFVKI
jgi:lysophospholipase L1-like esterase